MPRVSCERRPTAGEGWRIAPSASHARAPPRRKCAGTPQMSSVGSAALRAKHSPLAEHLLLAKDVGEREMPLNLRRRLRR